MDLMTDDTFAAGILDRPRRGEATGVLMYHERSPLAVDLLLWHPATAVGIHRTVLRADLLVAMEHRSVACGDVTLAPADGTVQVSVGVGVDAVTTALDRADLRRFVDATEEIVPATDIAETRVLDRLAAGLRDDHDRRRP